MNCYSEWFPWTASHGNLDLSLNGGKSPILAVYLPVVQLGYQVSVYNGASLIYETSEPGPETIPIPPLPNGLLAVTLTGSNPNPVYVFATSQPLPPHKEIDMSGQTTGGRLTSVPADGSGTVHVGPLGFTIAAISLAAGLTGSLPTPQPTLVPDYCNPTGSGFDVYVTGGAPGSTCNVDWTVFF